MASTFMPFSSQTSYGLHVFICIFGGELLVFILLFMADVCCSIELEPKTLNQFQLHQAREVAADVVGKMEPNEASEIFSEDPRGVEPVNETKKKEKTEEEGVGRQCQCSCAEPNNFESPDHQRPIPSLNGIREPLSAPF